MATTTINQNISKFSLQLVGTESGKNAPVVETSYIAAPNSIAIEEIPGEMGITTYNVTWKPLTTYLGEIRNDITTYFNNIQSDLGTYFNNINIKQKASQPITTDFVVLSYISNSGNTINIEKTTINVSKINELIESVSTLNNTVQTLSSTVTKLSDDLIKLTNKVNSYHPGEKETPTITLNTSYVNDGHITSYVSEVGYFDVTVLTTHPSAGKVSVSVTNNMDNTLCYISHINGEKYLDSYPKTANVDNNAIVRFAYLSTDIVPSDSSYFITITGNQKETSTTNSASKTLSITFSSIINPALKPELSILSESGNLTVGKTFVASATILNIDVAYYGEKVSWESTNTGVATVSNITNYNTGAGITSFATITAVGVGTTTIRASKKLSESSTLSDEYELKVTSDKPEIKFTSSNAPYLTVGESAKYVVRVDNIDIISYGSTVKWEASPSAIVSISDISYSYYAYQSSYYIISNATVTALSSGSVTIRAYKELSGSSVLEVEAPLTVRNNIPSTEYLYYWGDMVPSDSAAETTYFGESYFTKTSSKLTEITFPKGAVTTYYYIYPKEWGSSAKIDQKGDGTKLNGVELSSAIMQSLQPKYYCTQMPAGEVKFFAGGTYLLNYK